MKKSFLNISLALLLINISFSSISQIIYNPEASLTLSITQEKGTNGTAVVYNPIKEIYYTFIAGNKSYPLETFNTEGVNLQRREAQFDIRGAWWNTKTKTIEFNCYSDGGINGYKLNDNGIPTMESTTIFEGDIHQPHSNSVGCYDTKKKIIHYFYDGEVYRYSRKNGELISQNKVDFSYIPLSSINNTTMFYTGKKKMEFGFLDYINRKIYLVDKKTMKVTEEINLPDDTIVSNMFRLSYANNQVFLFDIETRTWTGYQIFN